MGGKNGIKFFPQKRSIGTNLFFAAKERKGLRKHRRARVAEVYGKRRVNDVGERRSIMGHFVAFGC